MMYTVDYYSEYNAGPSNTFTVEAESLRELALNLRKVLIENRMNDQYYVIGVNGYIEAMVVRAKSKKTGRQSAHALVHGKVIK